MTEVLRAAGWRDVEVVRDDRTLYLGGPGVSVAAAASAALDFGVLRAALQGRPADVLAAARADLVEDLRPLHDGTGVGLPGGVLIVSATAGR